MNAAESEAAAELSRAVPEMAVGLHADVRNELNTNTAAHGLREALRAQLARFEQLMGRAPTHLDSHHNVHRDPRALPHFLELARDHDLPLREHSPVRYFSRFYGRWGGKSHLEQISVESLARMLQTRMEDGITELSCHPGYIDPNYLTGYAAERETELRTLCDPLIRRVLAEQSIQLASFCDLGKLLASAPV